MTSDKTAKPWDLARAQRVDASMLAGYRAAMERFARAWARRLAAVSRAAVTVEPVETLVESFGDYASARAGEHCLNVLRADGLRCPGLLRMDGQALSSLTTVFLGGAAAPAGLSNDTGLARATMTWRLARRVTGFAMEELGETFARAVPLGARCTRQETHLEMTGLMSDREVALVTRFDLQVGGRAGVVELLWPLAAWRETMRTLGASMRGETGPSPFAAAIGKVLGKTEIELTAVLGEASVLIRDLLRLEVGDVLRLDAAADEPIELRAEGIRKWRGRPGVARGHRALKIVG